MGIKILIAAKLALYHYQYTISTGRPDLFFNFTVGQLLTVNGLQDLGPAPHRRLRKRLALTQLQKDLGLLEFLFVLLEGLVDVFAIF